MIEKRFNKKAQETAKPIKLLMWALSALAIAFILYFILRSIGNAVLPK